MSIVEYAERFVDDYDRIFCVFDRDGHANYDAAVQRIAGSPHSRANRLFAIPSWPCFELWMLLHFRYSSAAIVAAGGRSSGDLAVRELLRFIPGSQKGRKSTYRELLPNRTSAMTNARRLQRENAQTRAYNPSTRVHELVAYLLNLR
jgi:hypothetical protein